MPKFRLSRPQGLTLLFGAAVWLFYLLAYPYHLHYQEQLQLFLFTRGYLLDLLARPGGLSDYVGTFLTQFFYVPWIGPLVMALLLVAMQRLVYRVARPADTSKTTFLFYPLTFIPSCFYALLLLDESYLVGGMVSVLLGLLAWWWLRDKAKAWLPVLLPVIYWVAGGAYLFVGLGGLLLIWLQANRRKPLLGTCLVTLFTVALGICMPLAAKALLPQYPLMRLLWGADYYRFLVTFPYSIWVLWGLLVLCTVGCHGLMQAAWPQRLKKRTGLLLVCAQGVLVVGMLGWVVSARDTAKEDVMAYDYLVRTKQWEKGVKRANKKTPSSPLSVADLNLCLYQCGRLSDDLFNYFQNGPEGLIPSFSRDFTIPLVAGEIYYYLGFVNTAQRFAFEAMEAAPDYRKSARAIKRLAETNLINGQYAVAKKYLDLLTHTLFYRSWALKTTALLGQEEAINAHPEWGLLRQIRTQQDFLDSEEEKDMMIGLLLQQHPKHRMAYEYLLAYCLLTKDLDHFYQYFSLGSALDFKAIPKSHQEGLMFVWSLKVDDPFNTIPFPISNQVKGRMNQYRQLYLQLDNPEPALRKNFADTYWYYYQFRN